MGTKRASPGFTFDACHGCHEAPKGWQGRRKNEVCDTCRKQLDFAKRIADEAAADTEKVTLIAAERDYALPYLHEAPRDAREAVTHGFWQLSMLVSQASTEWPGRTDDNRLWPIINKNQRCEWEFVRIFPKAIADTLRETYRSVAAAIVGAHKAGELEGRNLLMQLADGTITNDAFNERAARMEGS